MTTAVRFIAHTDSTAGPLLCWPWTGATDDHGYGVLQVRGHVVRATHIALELDDRTKVDGLYALHHCDNPICVNPQHLYWGTQKENVADAHRRGRANTGERNGQAKLTMETARAIRFDRTTGLSYAVLAERYGVGISTICRVVRGDFWKDE